MQYIIYYYIAHVLYYEFSPNMGEKVIFKSIYWDTEKISVLQVLKSNAIEFYEKLQSNVI